MPKALAERKKEGKGESSLYGLPEAGKAVGKIKEKKAAVAGKSEKGK